MAGSSNNIDTGALYFGSANPTVTGQEVDNDSYIVTSDGTSTGTPISFWKFDEETLTWVQVPSGNSCPAPMTRAALIALRNANGLSKDCDYVITDHVQGRLVAGTTIHFQAVSANELSENVQVNTTYDNEAWRGIYDIDRGLVLELQDNRNNIARGINGNEVTDFDWGNTSYTNVVVDNATLTVNIGNTAPKQNITVSKAATLNLTGFTGSISNFDVSTAASVTFTNANGTWRLMRIWDGGSFNASGYTGGGDNYYNTIWGASTVNFSNTTQAVVLIQNDIQASSITNSGVTTAGASFNLNKSKLQFVSISRPATVNGSFTAANYVSQGGNTTHNTGTMNLASCQNLGSTIQQDTSLTAVMTLSQCIIEQASNVTNQAGTLSMTYTNVKLSTINNVAGSLGTTTVNHTDVTGSSSVTRSATATVGMTVHYSKVENFSSINQGGAATMTVTRAIMLDNGVIQADAGSAGTFTVYSIAVEGGSVIRKFATSTAGSLTVNGGGRLQSSSVIHEQGTGDLTVTQPDFTGSSGIIRTAGDRGYSFTRLYMSGVARANLSGTGAAITDTHNELEIRYRGNYNNSASGAANSILYTEITGLLGALTLAGTTGGSTLNRIKIYDGTFNKTNNPNAGTYQLWRISDDSVVTVTNNAAGDVFNYIDVSNASSVTINKTAASNISTLQVLNGGAYNMTDTAGAVSKVLVEQGTLNHSGGTLTNVSKKMTSTFTVTGGTQNNVHHWNSTNKTTSANNTNRVDYLGVVSTAPIV